MTSRQALSKAGHSQCHGVRCEDCEFWFLGVAWNLSCVCVLASYVFCFLLRFLSGSGVDPASWGDVWRDVLMWWMMVGVVSGWIGYGLRSISMCLLPSASVRCSASLFPLFPAPFPAPLLSLLVSCLKRPIACM